MTLDAFDILQLMTGRWTLARSILSLEAPPVELGSATGSVSILGTGPERAYREEGLLMMAEGTATHFTKAFEYTAEEKALLIRFGDGPEEGKAFVQLDFSHDGQSAEAVYDCPPDFYEMAVTVLPGIISMAVTVTGPKKAHRIETVLTQADAGGGA